MKRRNRNRRDFLVDLAAATGSAITGSAGAGSADSGFMSAGGSQRYPSIPYEDSPETMIDQAPDGEVIRVVGTPVPSTNRYA